MKRFASALALLAALAGPALAQTAGGTTPIGQVTIGGSLPAYATPPAFTISGTLPAFSSPPIVNLGTLNGAATAANQTTGNTSLSSIAAAFGSVGSAFPSAAMALGVMNPAGSAMTYLGASNPSFPHAADVNLVAGGILGSPIAAVATDGSLLQTRGIYGASVSLGALTATGTTSMNLLGYSGGVVTVNATGTAFSGRIEYSEDGATWAPIAFMGNPNSDAAQQVNFALGTTVAIVAARPQMRFNVQTCTSCSVTVSYTPWNNGPIPIYGQTNATLQSGSALIGDIGLNRINVTGSQSVPSTTAAHGQDTCFGGVVTLAAAVKNSGSTGSTGTNGKVRQVTVTFGSSAVPASLEVVFFNAALTSTPPCTSDAGAFTTSTTDGVKIVGPTGTLSAPVKGTSTFVWNPVDLYYSLASSTTLYAYVINRGASINPAAGVTVSAILERN